MKGLQRLCAALIAIFPGFAFALGSLADITVYDRAQGRQLPLYWHEGRAYVVGNPGNEYSIRIRNKAREDLLAVVSVDGVNVVTGQTASPQQSGYVLQPWRVLDLQGWRKNLASTAAFYFTPLPDSYAARTGRPDHVGVIGVALFKRKPRPQPFSQIAPAAPLARSEASRDAASGAAEAEPRAQAEQKLGTGHGRVETSHARYASFERATSEPAETVIIYYDSYRNLAARGVIREPVAPRLPHPHPFPGFVPDPPA